RHQKTPGQGGEGGHGPIIGADAAGRKATMRRGPLGDLRPGLYLICIVLDRPGRALSGDPRMTITIGDRIPDATLTTMTPEGPKPVSTAELFGGKTVALFAVPGAFTPTCSARHLPGYKDNRADLTAKGVDTVACVAVNDAFVMGAWAEAS